MVFKCITYDSCILWYIAKGLSLIRYNWEHHRNLNHQFPWQTIPNNIRFKMHVGFISYGHTQIQAGFWSLDTVLVSFSIPSLRWRSLTNLTGQYWVDLNMGTCICWVRSKSCSLQKLYHLVLMFATNSLHYYSSIVYCP